MISRRGFLVGASASGCAMAVAHDAHAPLRDENFSVFLSDPHVPGNGTELDKNHVEHDPAYMYKRLSATVDEVTTKVEGRSLWHFLIKQPFFRGYIHGHHHFWKTDRLLDWGRYTVRRVATLPFVGFWGDLGYALFRTSPHLAQLKPVITEFCFPRHQPDPAKRPATWSAIVADAQNATCRFPLDE